jgi:phospho-N-acetylmuramoyl-pentapeptide-transferase
MLYVLIKHLRETGWLDARGLDPLRVFTFVTFQTTVAVLMSFLIVLLFGSRVIEWLRKQKIGDAADFDQDLLNEMMKGKKGTPTMGGVLIIGAIALTTLVLADLRNFYVLMALVCLIWLGADGAADDWLMAIFTYNHGRNIDEARQFYFPFFRADRFYLPVSLAGYVVIATLVMTGASNAVNLSDGLDGLAAGCMALVSFSFVLLALIAGISELAGYLLMPKIEPAGQMAVIAGAMLGACLGFLWFNCSPARVFMGDTGSLALGGLIGYIAIVVRQELMLALVGGIFVAEALSVMLQVSYFKYTRRKYGQGRRIFLVAPLHHHFQEKGGWTETQIVTRFWLIGAMLAAMALATVKLR